MMLRTARKQPRRTPITHSQVFNDTRSVGSVARFPTAIVGLIIVVAMKVIAYGVVTVTTDDMPGESRFS